MSDLHVICKIADSEYAIPASDVLQMESYSEVTPVPGVPSYVKGLLQIRQQVIPIIDSRARFGLPAKDPTSESRFVILTLGKRLVGILVDSAKEVRNFSPDAFTEPPEVLTNSNGFVRSVAQIKERIILLMDILKVVNQEADRG